METSVFTLLPLSLLKRFSSKPHTQTHTHTPVFSPPISLACPGKFFRQRGVLSVGGGKAWWHGPVCCLWACVRHGSSGTVIYRPSICDWGFGRSVWAWAWMCDLVCL